MCSLKQHKHVQASLGIPLQTMQACSLSKEPRPVSQTVMWQVGTYTVNAQTKNLDFRGFDSSRFLSLGGGIPRSPGNFP